MPLPPVRPRSLRHRLVLLTATGLLPVSMLGAWGVWTAVQGRVDGVQESTRELSRAIASAVESELDATWRTLEAMSRSPALVRGDLPAFYALARSEAEVRPAWAGVVLSDAQGMHLFRTSAPFEAGGGRTVDEESLRLALSSGAPVVGSILPGQGGRQAFAVRWPVRIDGRVAYVLTAAVQPDRILDVLAKQDVPQGWVIGVFDRSLSRVARTREHASIKPSATLMALLERTPGNAGSGRTRSLEGDEVFTSFTRLPAPGWTVAVGAPLAPVRMAVLASVSLYLAGALASVLVGLLLARRIARQITEGIRDLRGQAIALGDGHAVSPTPSAISEVNEMGQALEAAARRLRQANDDLQQALGQARSAARAKDEFLAVLGHEMRNPLSPMLMALHLMDMKADGKLERERQILRRQVDHMRRLVDDLLDISRITQGRMEIRPQPLNLNGLVGRAVDAAQPNLSLRGQSIDMQLPAEPVWVMGDETRLVQALSNLLLNALRFCTDGRVTVALEVRDARARLSVTDEGEGMAPETLARVFEPFHQAPQPLARQMGGLGLGLAIVKSIVELHGGRVSAESEGPGRGARFTIELPVMDAPHAQGEPLRKGMTTGAGRVLLVDDKTDALETLAEVLGGAGYVVRAVSHPREAIALMDGFWPDVAVLDIGLPDMDGYALAASLRASAPGWQGQFIALTGFGQSGDKERAMAAGFARHFTKPADPEDLLAALAELIGQRASPELREG